ncbi:MAG: 50S ribosomal protein L24 [Oscillospiraceae bacterium]|nr:50S ribosomal protein L24 [Ruminococcus sp.]MDE6707584.1 50S ribosomal protein L24 [Oscillospiraceae bacterium]
MSAKLHVKTGDTVILLTGADEYKYKDPSKKEKGRLTAKVVQVSPKEGKVIVEGINMVTKHLKPTAMGQSGNIVRAEAPIYASKVQLVCPKCGEPTRVGHIFEEKTLDNGKVKKIKLRVCKKCKKSFE